MENRGDKFTLIGLMVEKLMGYFYGRNPQANRLMMVVKGKSERVIDRLQRKALMIVSGSGMLIRSNKVNFKKFSEGDGFVAFCQLQMQFIMLHHIAYLMQLTKVSTWEEAPHEHVNG